MIADTGNQEKGLLRVLGFQLHRAARAGAHIRIEKCFEALIQHVHKSRLPPDIKRKAIGELDYLRLQSLCDLDRRVADLQLRKRWHALSTTVAQYRLFDGVRDAQVIMPRVLDFCGPRQVLASTPKESVKKERVLEADRTLDELSKRAFASPKLSPLERFACFCALRYLHLEARRSRAQRDSRAIRFVWRQIHPLLEKAHLLGEYRSEGTRQRLMFFLRNGFE